MMSIDVLSSLCMLKASAESRGGFVKIVERLLIVAEAVAGIWMIFSSTASLVVLRHRLRSAQSSKKSAPDGYDLLENHLASVIRI